MRPSRERSLSVGVLSEAVIFSISSRNLESDVAEVVKTFGISAITSTPSKLLTARRFNHPQIFKAGLVTRSVSEGQF